MAEINTYRRIEAVKLTIAILRHLADQTGPAAPKDVATALEIPHGTLMCHLATLADVGIVRFVGGHVEMDMGMSLFWARYRSRAKTKIDRLHQHLAETEI
jgi:DNA-binding IclR family transcriptional regulator